MHLDLKDTLWNDGTFILSHYVIENYGEHIFQAVYILNILWKPLSH